VTAFAPWSLTGESVVGLARGRGVRLGPMAVGVVRVPGPVLVVAVRYDGSPVGPYLELSVGEPARLGVRLGWCMTTTVVDSAAARSGGRTNWGFPSELGTLVWERDGGERSLRWVERDVEVRGEPGRVRLPAMVPVRALQRRRDGPVVVPGRLRGMAKLAAVTVSAPAGDALAPIAGRHRGVTVDSMRFLIRPARTPFGLASTLRAPLAAPEAALMVGVDGLEPPTSSV
jgi:hypothetical protein